MLGCGLFAHAVDGATVALLNVEFGLRVEFLPFTEGFAKGFEKSLWRLCSRNGVFTIEDKEGYSVDSNVPGIRYIS